MVGFIRRILKLEGSVSIWQALADHFTDHVVAWALSLTAAGLMAYLTAITKWMEPWGPLGWGAIGTLSFLVILLGASLGSYLRGSARAKRALAKFADESARTLTVNILADSFSKQRIRLSDFYHPFFRSVQYKKFTDCELYGPAAIFLEGGNFDTCQFHDIDVVAFNRAVQAPTITRFVQCTFERCNLYRVTIFVTSDQARIMQSQIGGPINVIAGDIGIPFVPFPGVGSIFSGSSTTRPSSTPPTPVPPVPP